MPECSAVENLAGIALADAGSGIHDRGDYCLCLAPAERYHGLVVQHRMGIGMCNHYFVVLLLWC